MNPNTFPDDNSDNNHRHPLQKEHIQLVYQNAKPISDPLQAGLNWFWHTNW